MEINKKNMVSVIIVSHSAEMGGSERSMLELLRGLKFEGVMCHVLLPSNGPLESELRNIPVSYSVVPYRWWTLNEDDNVKNVIEEIVEQSLAVFNEIQKINPKIIYTNTSVVNVGAIVAKELGIPHIWHIREFGEKDHKMNFILEEKKRAQYICANSDFVIFNSGAVEKHYKELAHFKNSAVVYNNVIVKSYAEEIYAQIFKRINSLHLAIVGSIQEGKGQKDAVSAVKELKKGGIDVELAIVGGIGNEKYEKEIKESIIKNDLVGEIFLTGYLDDPFSIMEAADIVLVCSKNEAFGRVTIEGMLAKKPIIGTNHGGTKELILDNVNGLLYEPGNYFQLAEKISELQNNPEKRKVMGERGYKFASENFSQERYSSKIKNILETLIVKKTGEQCDIFHFSALNFIAKRFKQKNRDLQSKDYEIRLKNQEIETMRDSKFWKLREQYLNLKNIFKIK